LAANAHATEPVVVAGASDALVISAVPATTPVVFASAAGGVVVARWALLSVLSGGPGAVRGQAVAGEGVGSHLPGAEHDEAQQKDEEPPFEGAARPQSRSH
jgi:hypothetical protein